MRLSSGLTIRDTVSQDDYAPTWDPIGVTFIFKNWLYILYGFYLFLVYIASF